MRKYITIFNLLIGLIPINSVAQNINIGGVFPTIDHSGKINNKADYSLYYFSSFSLINLKEENQNQNPNPYYHLLYAEHALHYNFTNKFIITGSYVYQRENVLRDNYLNENRFYTQIKYKQGFTKISFTHRLRLDGRFVENRITKKAPFTHRLRYLIGLDYTIRENLYFTAYEEPFFNTSTISNPIYNENWAYCGLGGRVNAKNKLEIGLLFVTWNVGNKKWFNQYYLQITWINQIDLTKKDNK